MQTLGVVLKNVIRRPGWPAEAACPKCGRIADLNDPLIQAWAKAHEVADRQLDGGSCQGGVTGCGARRREAERLADIRFFEANLPQRRATGPRTFDNFEPIKGSEEALGECQAFAEHPSGTLMLSGVPGSGKSHLAEAAAREVLERGLTVRYEFAPSLMNHLRSAMMSDGDDLGERLGWYYSRFVLILDDIGTQPVDRDRRATPWVVSQMMDLVDQRCRDEMPLLVVTNHTQKEIAHILGERLASRLWDVHATREIVMGCGDYRKR